jgi:hypothetical protein
MAVYIIAGANRLNVDWKFEFLRIFFALMQKRPLIEWQVKMAKQTASFWRQFCLVCR